MSSTDNLYELGFWCFQCNTHLTKSEFASDEHLRLHIGKWLNNDIVTVWEILDRRKENPLEINTLENIIKDPSRRRGNKKGCTCRHD